MYQFPLKNLSDSTQTQNGKTPPHRATPASEDWSSTTQELLDILPRVWTRGFLYFLIAFAGFVLPWAMLSKVDETGIAVGRLEPLGATQRLDAPVPGTVTHVYVKEGQTVKAGQVLLELESDLVRMDLQRVQTKLESQLNRLAQLELIKNQLLIAIRAQQQQNQAQELEKQAQMQQAQQILSASQTAYTLQQDKLAQIEEAKANLSASKTAYSLAQSRFNRDMLEVKRYRQLHQEGVVPETQVVEKEKLADESQRLLAATRDEIPQAESRLKEQQGSYQKIIHQGLADIKQAESRLREQQSGYQSLMQAGRLAVLKSEQQLKDLEGQITSLQGEIQASKSQIRSLKFQLRQRSLRTPVSGTIFQLPIQQAGAVLQPSQMVAEIAPRGLPLVLRAQMATSQSGSLHQGMPVKMKFDAYPFQDYGVVTGYLSKIAPSSKVTDTTQGQIATYDLEITLNQSCIQSAKECIVLTPGQTATAEVIVRQRRVIDFILDPFKKLQKGGLEM
ncbi:HlyD family secretion protein [Fischerella muscicola CCMEE 5323]|uniref:HlyD family secretion protein n=1 Tax=Fischerella muscicola CCMEE 5323 TaxID=2019572 RepID=A0A2N6K3R6_FISMU|nr:HlyD family efflux transporter periplasmic adaptor subunit [Fischerella muscicola]PLZ90289.1 HlyD family secretion protein [Fischerella muscicola CCMEE 5323]